MKKVGLVTVLYNSPEVLSDFFSSIAIQNYKEYCLYIVDNSTNPESLNVAKKMCQELNIFAKFIDNEGNNVGVAAGNNQGARLAYQDGCDYILFLNNDLIFNDPNVVTYMMQHAAENQFEMISPLILSYPLKKIWYVGGYFNEWKAIAPHNEIDCEFDSNSYNKITQHAYAPTCFLMITKAVWESVGEMDERYFAYYDDTDFLYRAYKKGYIVNVIPDAIIYHKVGASTGGDISYFGMYHLTRNRLMFIRKNLSGIKKTISLCYVLTSRACIFVKSKNKKAIFKGIVDGLSYKL